MKKFLSLILCLSLVLSLSPVLYVSADEGDQDVQSKIVVAAEDVEAVASDEVSVEDAAAGAGDGVPAEDAVAQTEEVTSEDDAGLERVSSDAALGDISSWDEQDIISTATSFLETGFDPGEMIGWAASFILPYIFSGDGKTPVDEQIFEILNEVIANQEQMKSQLERIDNRIIQVDIQNNIREWYLSDKAKHLETYYNVLNNIDREDIQDSEKERKRFQMLLYDFTGQSEVTDTLCAIDDYPFELGGFITEGFVVSYGGKDNIFGMYHKWCTINYHWEHQAYDDWISFRDIVMMRFAMAASLDELSLHARIKYLKDNNKDADVLEQRLEDLHKLNQKAKKIYDDSKVKKRPDNVRYYWYPGNELLIYSKAKRQGVPEEKEHSKYGLLQLADDVYHSYENRKIQGLKAHKPGGYAKYVIDGPRLEFWRSFISYNRDDSDGGGTVLCPTQEWYHQVYLDYGEKKNLYDIFFSKDEGNLKAPSGSNKDWMFVVDPDTNHPMTYYRGGIFRCDEVVTPVMNSNGSPNHSARNGKGYGIYSYHNYSSSIDSKVTKAGHPFIGIGVAPDEEPVAFAEYDGVVTDEINEAVTLKATATKKYFKLEWSVADKATKYEVYQAKAGSKKYKKIKTITDPNKNTLNVSRKKLKKKSGYKYYVKVTADTGLSSPVTVNSYTVVVYPTKGKYTNAKSINLGKGITTTMNLGKGKTKSLGASAVKVKKKKKFSKTFAKVRYKSSDTAVATVSKKGKITAKAAGKCFIYAYTPNGISKTIELTVE